MNNLLSAAIEYAELGYLVFPLVRDRKTPYFDEWNKKATNNCDQLENWWRKWPEANIGIHAKDLIIIDIDGTNTDWIKHPMDCDAIAVTPSEGHHYLYKKPEGKKWRNTIKQLDNKNTERNVDTRTDDGYIVAFPSIINDKKYTDGKYQWVVKLEVGPAELSEPPDWVINELDKEAEKKRSMIGDLGGTDTKIPEGKREKTLHKMAWTMRENGFSYRAIASAIEAENDGRCEPPMEYDEIEKIVKHASKTKPDEGRTAYIEGEYDELIENERAKKEAKKEPEYVPEEPEESYEELPIEMLRIPGFISELMDHTMETAPHPNQALAFCGALSLQAFLGGRKVRDEQNNRTNLYLLALAQSASGKDHPRKVNAEILYKNNIHNSLGDLFASSEGVQDALYVCQNMIFQTDEIDGMLQAIKISKDARYEQIMNVLLKIYSSANSVFPMRRLAGRSKGEAIDQPCLNIFGTAIPQHYHNALSEKMLTNGFFARFITIETGKRGRGQRTPHREVPKNILKVSEYWKKKKAGKGNLSHLNPTTKVVNSTEEAKKILDDSWEEVDEEYSKVEDNSCATTVWGRVNEHTLKLALVYAISENHVNPIVSVKGAKWASKFSFFQARRMLYNVKHNVSDNEFHSEVQKVLKNIKKSTKKEVSHSFLLRKMRMDSKNFYRLISTMIESGELEVNEKSTTGRTGKFYTIRRNVKDG